MAEVDKYKCEVCGGEGSCLSYWFVDAGATEKPERVKCKPCHGTGQKQKIISLEEYDRLNRINTCLIFTGLVDYKKCSTIGGCLKCKIYCEQAILSYGKEDGEK